MRPALPLLVLAVLLPAPTVTGQDIPLPPPVAIDDPAGDLEGFVPAEGAGFVDLLHAEVRPTEAAIEFEVTVADLTTDVAAGIQWELWLDFEYRGAVFHFTILGQTSAEMPQQVRDFLLGSPYAALYEMNGEFPTPAVTVPAFLDRGARTWNTTLPWEAIQEPGGYTPQPGESLRLREVATIWDLTLSGSPHQGFPVGTAGTSTADRAAFPEGTFLSVPGAVGDLSLTTPIPVRSSNGEAATFHWPVEVRNGGGRELDVTFTLDALDGAGRVPPGLRLAPGSNATINVYVTLPFSHAHGTTRQFPLTARAGAADVATLRLGVDYPAVAQPAGHHPDLYLHSSVEKAFGAVDVNAGPLWMNTLEEDPSADAPLLMPFEGNCPEGADIDLPQPVGPISPIRDFGVSWEFPLSPQLALGLDGRLGEAASLDLQLVADAAAPAGMLYARLLPTSEEFLGGPFVNRTDPFRGVAAIPPTTGPATLDLHLDVPMPESLDLVLPSRTENLVLALLYCWDSPAPVPLGAGPAIASAFAGIMGHAPYAIRAGAHLRLAVDEYHDVIPVAASAAGLALDVEEPVRSAAPGATVLWRPTLSFPETDDGTYAVRLFGTGAEHAALRGAASVRGPFALDLPVSFVVPDAQAGEVFDLLLDVTHAGDPARSVGLRLTVVVDPTQTRDDAGELAALPTASKQSPPASLGIALLALAMLALRRRR